MNILLLPMCLIGRHHRDVSAAYMTRTGVYRSVCGGCGRAMWRDLNGWSMNEPTADGVWRSK